MKKLLELLGIILITSNAAGPLIANKPNNNKSKIKNSLETLTRQKRQAPPAQTDIIEKEITLDKNYSQTNNLKRLNRVKRQNDELKNSLLTSNEIGEITEPGLLWGQNHKCYFIKLTPIFWREIISLHFRKQIIFKLKLKKTVPTLIYR